MCLNTKHTNQRKKFLTSDIDRKGLKVYKIVARHTASGKDYPLFSIINTITRRKPYKEGLNEANTSRILDAGMGWNSFQYVSGFHFYREQKAATEMIKYIVGMKRDIVRRNYELKIVECIIKKSWITAVGTEDGILGIEEQTVIVSKKAIFPEPLMKD